MACTELIGARVTPLTKARFRALAEQEQVSESVLLKRLIGMALHSVNPAEAAAQLGAPRRLRGARLTVRLHPDDQLLLIERAAARQMATATYVSVLLRAHLRSLAPLPKEELKALKHSIAQLGVLGRNMNQLVRLAHQQGKVQGIDNGILYGIMKGCEGMHANTKRLLKANARSWELGYETVSS
ncbi:hypothetical protein HNQ60_000551 [Povalibacter uvarum]|uniref:Bacterial mobilisation domain-containing protein n=1 Tax=Povalibacter uvarum TaxID=732238 RepID=A0A841HI10_9GAMM|nr:hypothetical protein [Povalibacter uvarum]MBB6091705.1 hypothetical protein [Povalibacter uvarum]